MPPCGKHLSTLMQYYDDTTGYDTVIDLYNVKNVIYDAIPYGQYLTVILEAYPSLSNVTENV